MKFGTSIMVFFLAIIALVAEFILYIVFGIGPALSGDLTKLSGTAFFFVSLMVLTGATGVLAPICALVELIIKKKNVGVYTMVSILGLILVGLVIFSTTGLKTIESNLVADANKSPKTDTEVSKPLSAIKLQLINFDVKRLPVNYDVSRYRPKAVLTLYLKNNTSKRIKAWRALIIVKNAFGDVLFRARLTDGSANIPPGGTEKASFSWEDNQFIDDEPYDKLVAYSKENIKIEIKEVQLIQ